MAALLGTTALSAWIATQQNLLPVDVLASIQHLLVLLTSGFWVVLIWIAGYGLGVEGARALDPDRKGHPDALTASVVGVGAIFLGHWVNSITIGMAGWVVWLLVGPLVLLGCWHIYRARPWETGVELRGPMWSVALVGLPLGVLLTAAACPPGSVWRIEAFGYDVLSYHLQLPREWAEASSLEGFEHNVYSFFPSLIEAGYSLLYVLAGRDTIAMIETSQLLHASFTVAAALAVGRMARRRSAVTGWVVAAAFLAMPWSLITGSMAYNEMAVLAFAAVALDRVTRERALSLEDAVLIGFLLGLATASKLTAGPMLAVPIVAIALCKVWSGGGKQPVRQTLRVAVAITLAGTVVLTPYLARNGLQTGNPVFPFAASVLGSGHWTGEEIDRWDRAHLDGSTDESILVAFDRQWLRNTGYGAVGGRPVAIETRNIARFTHEGGFPLLWPVTLAGVVLGLRARSTRPLAFALVAMLGWQIFFWVTKTHLQSRFLIPTLLPGLLLAGLAVEALVGWLGSRRWLAAGVLSVWVLVLAGIGFGAFWRQTLPIRVEGQAQAVPAPPVLLVGSLASAGFTEHPINNLPPESRTYLIADNSRLLYLSRPFVYNSAFDRSRLGDWIREADGVLAGTHERLRAEGITHLWVHWGELDRLHSTYGFDGDVTASFLRRLTSGWPVVEDLGVATLYRVPSIETSNE